VPSALKEESQINTPYMIDRSMCRVEQESDPEFKVIKGTEAK
jgi:hypothetical protein